MSYLEMAKAPLPDMSSGIISIWFRDATKGPAPTAEAWPSGLWTPGTDSMVPPWTQEIVQDLSPSSAFFWDAYGAPLDSFQGLLTGPAAVWMPTPPPFATDTVHMLLSFGDPDQPYNFCPWRMDSPNVIKAVNYTGEAVPGIGFNPNDWPPPYAPYFINVGDDGGKFTVRNMRLEPPVAKPKMVPQSFIGVDKDGYLIICLQTNTRATYKGYAFELADISELKARATTLVIDGPPYSYSQIGFPYPDGHFEEHPGYWDGYQFTYNDVSNEVMSGQPEIFVLGGPPVYLDFFGGPVVSGNTWHHLLFSFDISGSVTCEQPDDAASGAPTVTTKCKAWLAVDDRNYTDMALQRRVRIPDGLVTPLLPGMGHDILFGKLTSWYRGDLSLGPNDIVPQNIWIRSFSGGYPRDGLLQYASNSGLSTGPPDNEHYPAGDFNGLAWTASLWTLYWPAAPGPAFATMEPPRPTVPNPATFDKPIYECASFSIPVNGHPIGIPATARHLTHNTGLEMGELQIWANKTLDTADVNMRRLFVDKDGKPVLPNAAEKVLGKPDILLNGSGNWQAGTNTGRSGFTATGAINPAGQFRPIAKIKSFLPDPQLGK
jgi:hypothetical protein